MVVHRSTRLVLVFAAAALALPGVAAAAEPGPTAPPAPVVAWQAHLAHMQSMPGPFGAHVKACVAMHGSMAGQLGPNGAMVEMMGEMVR